MKRPFPLAAAASLLLVPALADAACCYFAAKDKDITQPGQKAFISWDAEKKIEAFTVQPKFEGNAVDFGMVIPTPSITGRIKLIHLGSNQTDPPSGRNGIASCPPFQSLRTPGRGVAGPRPTLGFDLVPTVPCG